MKGTRMMAKSNDANFTSEEIDQQIEHYLSSQQITPEEQAAQHALQQLQRVYQAKNDQHAPSLERVWQRVQAASIQEDAGTLTPTIKQDDVRQDNPFAATRSNSQHQKRRRAYPLLAQMAAALFCLLLVVGSFVLVTTFASHKQTTPISNTVTSPGGLYAYQNQAIYRLDTQTHQILWKHTFTNNEMVTGSNESFFGVPQLPFFMHGILYVETNRNITSHIEEYLYAINAANGTILWRQPSARVFINNEAIYTLVESTTSDISTLTARDLRTGQQLWQHQYNIVGSKKDPARGTDNTDGFRLITVTDQILYAVASYPQNGQNIFARYALSPKDGSIMWQNHEAISGSMSSIEAQVVDGTVYTTEYNLKPIPGYVTAQGITVNEMIQVHAIAYDAITGTRRWRTPEMVRQEPNGGFALTVSHDMLYFKTFYQDLGAPVSPNITTLYALSVKDGSQRWKYQVKDGPVDGAVLEGNSLYFETYQIKTVNGKQDFGLKIVALDAQTGSVRWSTPVQLLDGTEKTPTPVPHSVDPGFSSGYIIDMAPVASKDAIYYSTPGSRVYVLRPSDGKILSQFWVDKTPQTTVLYRAALFVAP
jgi:outer membrane protein assembly factor BamB